MNDILAPTNFKRLIQTASVSTTHINHTLHTQQYELGSIPFYGSLFCTFMVLRLTLVLKRSRQVPNAIFWMILLTGLEPNLKHKLRTPCTSRMFRCGLTIVFISACFILTNMMRKSGSLLTYIMRKSGCRYYVLYYLFLQ